VAEGVQHEGSHEIKVVSLRDFLGFQNHLNLWRHGWKDGAEGWEPQNNNNPLQCEPDGPVGRV